MSPDIPLDLLCSASFFSLSVSSSAHAPDALPTLDDVMVIVVVVPPGFVVPYWGGAEIDVPGACCEGMGE